MRKKVLFVTNCYPSVSDSKYGIFIHQLAKASLTDDCKIDVIRFDSEINYTFDGINVYSHLLKKRNRFKRYFSFFDSDLYQWILDFIKNNNYSFIVLHIVDLYIINTIIKACNTLQIKCAIYYHGLNVVKDFTLKNNPFTIFYRKHVLKACDLRICVSEQTKNVVNKYTNKETLVIHNGVNIDLFLNKNFRNFNDLNILSIGNLIKIKGHIYLLKALNKIKKSSDFGDLNYKLTIVGNGPEIKRLNKYVFRNKMSSFVSFIPSLTYDQIATKMRENNYFVLPSFFEAFGCVFLEAMSSGMIAFGCKNQGNSEFMKNNYNSFLIKERSYKDLANKLTYCFLNTSAMSSISSNAIKTSKDFTWGAAGGKLKDVFNKMC